MLGTAERGTLACAVSRDGAALPIPVDPLSKFGAGSFIGGPVTLPWAYTHTTQGVKANAQNKYSDALLQVSNKASEVNIYQVPTVVVSYQLPPNSRGGMQVKRLPLNMVNPVLAWRPG